MAFGIWAPHAQQQSYSELITAAEKLRESHNYQDMEVDWRQLLYVM